MKKKLVKIVVLTIILLSGHVIADAKTSTKDFIVKDKIIYQKKDTGTLSVYGFKKGITKANIVNSIKGMKVTTISWQAFRKCSTLKSVIVPDSVSVIGGDAFYGCKSLTSIKIPSGVRKIGGFAFASCKSLEGIMVPEQLKIIAEGVFEGCTSLVNIRIPQRISYISSDAFSGCKKLNCINVDKNNKIYSSVDGILFNKKRTKLICYPMGVSNITYRIPKSVKVIGSNAFKHCNKLRNLTISAKVKRVDGFAFSGCTSLSNVTIEDGVKKIDGFAFSGCRSLKEIHIPKSVKDIGYSVFSGCRPDLKITYQGPQKKVKWF